MNDSVTDIRSVFANAAGFDQSNICEEGDRSSFDEWIETPTLTEQAKTLFTAERADEEPWRISRLKDVYETAQQICMIVYRQPFPADAVARMHDHKGELTVQFTNDQWARVLAGVFRLAWESVNEPDFTSISLEDGTIEELIYGNGS